MSTQTEARPWDFTQVLDLVNSLSTRDTSLDDAQHEAVRRPATEKPKGQGYASAVDCRDFATPAPTLGDFGNIWQFLGTPADSPTPTVPRNAADVASAPISSVPSKIDYTSDGATYFKAGKSGKGVIRFAEAVYEEPVTDTATDRSASPGSPTLTKTQRKKQKRKERRAAEAAEARRNATVSESEADVFARKTPARKASAHVVTASESNLRLRKHEPSIPENSRPSVHPATLSAPTVQASVELARARVAEQVAQLKKANPQTPLAPRPGPPSRLNQSGSGKPPKPYIPSSPTTQRAALAYTTPRGQQFRQLPASTPSHAPAMQFVPSTVQPPAHMAARSILTQSPRTPSQNIQPATTSKLMIEPKIVRSGEDRHWALLMKIINNFWEDRKYLLSPMNLTTHNNDPKGLHLFVDASNIFIGFTDQLKRSRGIHPRQAVPQVELSFDALALLMERRRPVAKRVLVGSTPHQAAFDKAKAVGYECNILEKVFKARELTERQIYFKEHDKHGRPRSGVKTPQANGFLPGNASGIGSPTPVHHRSGSGSGSETTAAPQYAPARMIEQGVDEILHLKMLESIVDTEIPSTIVLATGDAAAAEYSPGFMAMVERALKKGWAVELVSWSKPISMMYSRRQWVETWGPKFKVIFLDDYAEELLEM